VNEAQIVERPLEDERGEDVGWWRRHHHRIDVGRGYLLLLLWWWWWQVGSWAGGGEEDEGKGVEGDGVVERDVRGFDEISSKCLTAAPVKKNRQLISSGIKLWELTMLKSLR
jgi:hypothetical protein